MLLTRAVRGENASTAASFAAKNSKAIVASDNPLILWLVLCPFATVAVKLVQTIDCEAEMFIKGAS